VVLLSRIEGDHAKVDREEWLSRVLVPVGSDVVSPPLLEVPAPVGGTQQRTPLDVLELGRVETHQFQSTAPRCRTAIDARGVHVG